MPRVKRIVPEKRGNCNRRGLRSSRLPKKMVKGTNEAAVKPGERSQHNAERKEGLMPRQAKASSVGGTGERRGWQIMYQQVRRKGPCGSVKALTRSNGGTRG